MMMSFFKASSMTAQLDTFWMISPLILLQLLCTWIGFAVLWAFERLEHIQ